MKRLLSWMLTILMLVSCIAVMAMPAAAAEELINLYDDATEGSCARATTDVKEETKGLSTPYLAGSSEYIAPNPIPVAAGDTIYYGPANAGQGYQLVFYPTSGSPVQVGASGCTEVFTFDGPLATTSSSTATNTAVVMYKYTATSAGSVRLVVPQEYHDIFVVTKNQPMTYDSYYAYLDAKQGRNLWNFYTGCKTLINQDGTVGTNKNHYATHFIAVEPGDTITWGPHRDSMYYGAVGYNAEKVGVTNAIQVGTQNKPMSAGVTKVATFTADNQPLDSTAGQQYSIYSYKVPEGVSYVRVLLYKDVATCFQVQKNNEFDIEGYWKLMGGDMESPLFNADSLWLGDSIGQAAGDMKVAGVDLDGWVGRVSKAFNMTWANYSRGGWSLSNGRLNSTYSRIVQRLYDGLASEPANGYGLVMLHGGTNDAWSYAPVGSMTDSFYPGDYNVDTFAGALEELFYYATTLYGDTAEIAYILNFKMADRTNAGDVHRMDPHYAVALQICEKWGIIPIDLYHNDTINSALDNNTLFAFHDFVHPGRKGYDYFTPFINEALIAGVDGKVWMKGEAEIATEVTSELIAGVADDDHFTAKSKAAFAAAAVGATTEEKLAAALVAAPALKQDPDNLISILDMTKYNFMDPKDFAVSTAKEMAAVAHWTNIVGYLDGEDTIYLQNDITMSGTQYAIGSGESFKATFDGQGHSIIGVQLAVASTASNDVNVALFPRINNATIKNLTLKNANSKSRGWGSLLIGVAAGEDNLVENCHVVDSTLTNDAGNGMSAILLQPNNRGNDSTDGFTIRGCTVSGCTINLNNASGDVTNIGWISNRVFKANQIIENCYTYNNVINVKKAINLKAIGGLVSEGKNGKIINSGAYNNTINNQGGATIDATMNSALVGYVMNKCTFTISGSYSDSALPLACTAGTGAVNATNCFSVGAGNITAEEIKDGTLVAKLSDATGAAWGMKKINDELSLPMIGNGITAVIKIRLGDMIFYTDSEGKINLGNDAAALAGKVWKKDGQTFLTSDLLARVFEEAEVWEEAEYLLGDCMGGNTLDTADAIALLQTLVGKTVEGYQAECADINGDGAISLADVVRILRYIAAGRSVA